MLTSAADRWHGMGISMTISPLRITTAAVGSVTLGTMGTIAEVSTLPLTLPHSALQYTQHKQRT